MALNEFRSIFLILMVNVRQALLTRRDWALSSISPGGERKARTYENWELTVVDDGSTDSSLEEIPRDDQRFRVLTQGNSTEG